MNSRQRRIAIGAGVLAVVGGIAFFAYNRPVIETSSPGHSVAASPSPAMTQPAAPEPTAPPTVPVAEHVRPAPALVTLPFPTESWEDAVRTMTVEQARERDRREFSRVSYARMQRCVEESGLTGAARARLEVLLFDKQSVDVDVTTTARRLGLPPSDPQVQALLQSERAAIDNAIRSLVGDDFFGRIEAGRLRMDDRLYAVEFVGELYQRGTPLSAEQRAMVNQVVTNLDAGDAQRWARSVVDPASGLTAYDSSLIRELTGALTTEQLEAVRQVRIEKNLDRAYREYQRSRSNVSGPNHGGG